jgi:hypothetical protein
MPMISICSGRTRICASWSTRLRRRLIDWAALEKPRPISASVRPVSHSM